MTVQQAILWANSNPNCLGFTYNCTDREPTHPVHVWFKSKLSVLYNESWWSYSNGRGVE